MKGDYLYGVIECDMGSVINRDVSHWVFKTITEANDHAAGMQASNPELRFIVLHLNKR